MLDTQLIHCCKKCLSFHNPTKGRTVHRPCKYFDSW